MPRYKHDETPVSVILRTEQADWLKAEALKNERTYSQQLRFIVSSYIDFHKESGGDPAGNKGPWPRPTEGESRVKEVKKAGQKGKKGQEVTA